MVDEQKLAWDAMNVHRKITDLICELLSDDDISDEIVDISVDMLIAVEDKLYKDYGRKGV